MRHRTGLFGWVIAAAVLLAGAAVAENTTTQANVAETSTSGETLPAASSAQPTAPGFPPAAGVRAFVDPATGRLTANPTRAQLQQVTVERRATSLSRSAVGLRPFELSRGGHGLNLEGRFQTAMRVVRQPDGSFRVSCGHGEVHEDGHAHDGAAAVR